MSEKNTPAGSSPGPSSTKSSSGQSSSEPPALRSPSSKGISSSAEAEAPPSSPAPSSAAPSPTPSSPGAAASAEATGQLAALDEANSQDQLAADLALYLPEGVIALRQAKEILATGKRAAKARLVSLLLTYAPWDEIWKLMDQDQIRKLFPHLDLPPAVERAWSRYLELES